MAADVVGCGVVASGAGGIGGSRGRGCGSLMVLLLLAEGGVHFKEFGRMFVNVCLASRVGLGGGFHEEAAWRGFAGLAGGVRQTAGGGTSGFGSGTNGANSRFLLW